MKISVSVASLCVGVFASGAFAAGAFAADVSVNGSLSEITQGSDNYFLLNAPSGYTLKSLSAIDLSVLAATPTTRYLLDSNYSYYKYFGPGANDTALTSGTPESEKFSINHTSELSKYNFAVSWQRSDLTTTLLTETGNATGRGSLDTYKVDGGVTRDLSRTDSISWSAHGTSVSFSDPGQTPYAEFATNVAWNRSLSPTTTLTNSVNFDWLDQDDVAGDQRLFWNATTALQSQLSPRLFVNGSVSAIFVNTYQTGAVQLMTPSTLGLQGQPGASHGWAENFGLRYQLSPSTQISLTAAQTTTPTVLGQLQQLDTIALNLSYAINHSSNLTFSTQFSHNPTPGSEADFFTASANYGYKLTREWRTNLSYTYGQRNDQTGLARSNTILFGLVRDFTLYGKPPVAVAKTLSDLAQEDLMRAQQALPGFGP